jgi:hypothetical protein
MSEVALGIAAVALAAAAAMGSGQAHASPVCKPPQCGGAVPGRLAV